MGNQVGRGEAEFAEEARRDGGMSAEEAEVYIRGTYAELSAAAAFAWDHVLRNTRRARHVGAVLARVPIGLMVACGLFSIICGALVKDAYARMREMERMTAAQATIVLEESTDADLRREAAHDLYLDARGDIETLRRAAESGDAEAEAALRLLLRDIEKAVDSK